MPELTLTHLLEAVRPGHPHPSLRPFVTAGTQAPSLESRRIRPPECAWVTYRVGGRRLTLKSFFSEHAYAHSATQLAVRFRERLGQLDAPAGGLELVPALNGILWSFPFDPVLPHLHRCLDTAHVGRALALMIEASDLEAEVLRYTPEVRALFAYRRGRDGPVLAYGKTAPREASTVLHTVMHRLWELPAREAGQLRLAQPLALLPEAGLLLQAPVAGQSISRQRNRTLFLRLAEHAGGALAALHASGIDLGPVVRFEPLLARLQVGLTEVTLTAPHLYEPLRHLLAQLEARAGRSTMATPVPSHGDFKYDQLLYDEASGAFSLIDFELFCQAEPWLDLGTFCAYLVTSSPRDWRDGAATELLRSAFLARYAALTGGWSVDFVRLGLYEATLLALRALAEVGRRRPGWARRSAQLLALAHERLVNPEPRRP